MSLESLDARFLRALNGNSPWPNRIAALLKDISLEAASFQQLNLCKAQATTLDCLYLSKDVNYQRPLNLEHVYTLLSNFKDLEVSPLLVYIQDNKFVIWDGQHTAIALLIIAKYILKQDIKDCIVPIAVYENIPTGYRFRNGFK